MNRNLYSSLDHLSVNIYQLSALHKKYIILCRTQVSFLKSSCWFFFWFVFKLLFWGIPPPVSHNSPKLCTLSTFRIYIFFFLDPSWTLWTNVYIHVLKYSFLNFSPLYNFVFFLSILTRIFIFLWCWCLQCTLIFEVVIMKTNKQ